MSNQEYLAKLTEELEELNKQRDELDIDPDEFTEQYDDCLNEVCGGCVKIGSLEYDAGRALREVDPIAYCCGLNDYVDGIEIEETEAYKDLTEEIEELESKISAAQLA